MEQIRTLIDAGAVVLVMAFYLGVALSLQLVWAIVLLPLGILAVDKFVVAREERYLTERFGDEYRHYVATTRRWLLARWRAS